MENQGRQTMEEFVELYIKKNLGNLMFGNEEVHGQLARVLDIGIGHDLENSDDEELEQIKKETPIAIERVKTLIEGLELIKSSLEEVVENAESYKSYNQE
ncbi:hypothetical protein SP15_272 [Bacillus phage SP-15]|uniref:Uncharacterized protein n=1 Tax=Bacillus phage SP-15 TaxID=1792032 RepID=A0A127AWT8_9CAUD|nr:hypothetical protein SP15_272 [Bacillus phage SP-15]AMM45080.1 hypothetical protein SP15_272 [Bacillus phage SP-15]